MNTYKSVQIYSKLKKNKLKKTGELCVCVGDGRKKIRGMNMMKHKGRKIRTRKIY